MTDKGLHIPNLHPSHRMDTGSSSSHDIYHDSDAELSHSFKGRLESFVGSYSRTSMMHMAENVVVSEGGIVSCIKRSFSQKNLIKYVYID
jgi:hypothetical protein